MAEVYAGFSEYTDAQVGRIVEYLEESGQLDNTIIFYCADNGASGEGSPNGSTNEGKFINGYPDTIEDNLAAMDVLGVAGHLQPLPDRLGHRVLHALPDVQALHLPGRGLRPVGRSTGHGASSRRGEVRHQYHHCTDIVPTIYEACGVNDARRGGRRRADPAVRVCRCVYSFNDAETADHEEDPVLRDVRQSRHLARGLEGRDRARADERSEQLRPGHVAALPHRRRPRRGARPGRRAAREGSRSSSALWFEEARANNVLPLNDMQVTGEGPAGLPGHGVQHPCSTERPVHLLPGHHGSPGAVRRERARRVLQGPR